MIVVVSNARVDSPRESGERRTKGNASLLSDRKAKADFLEASAPEQTAGEMSLQGPGGHHATEPSPQALLRLVGFREPTASPVPNDPRSGGLRNKKPR